MTETTALPDISLVPQRYEAFVPFDSLTPHPRNPNEGDLELLDELLRVNGFAGAMLVQEGTRVIIDGEQRMKTAREAGLAGCPVIWLDVDDPWRDRFLASWNESGRRGVNDMRKLVALLQGLEVTPQGLAGSAFGGDQLAAMVAALGGDGLGPQPGEGGDGSGSAGSLADRFLVPPFTVLDARQGYWQQRKRAWLSLGIRSEQGRPRNLLKMSDTMLDAVQGKGRMRDTGYDQLSLSQPRTAMLGNPRYAHPNRSAPGARPVRDPQFTAKHQAAEDEAGHPLTVAEFIASGYEPPPRAGNLDGAERRDTGWVSSVGGGPARNSGALRIGQPNHSTPGSDSGNDPTFYYKKTLAEREAGHPLTTAEFIADWYEGPDVYTNGTSVFDPVLAEVAYRWWCPPAGRVLDPFAGGSVRGVVASRLDLEYTGVDLSAAQVQANEEQATQIGPGGLGIAPAWVQGDARDITPDWPQPGQVFDLIFTCPPYYDLEQYSDDPADLSNAAGYDEFMAAFRQVLTASAARLADDRFAVLVVGEIRDTKGMYRGFVPDTIAAAASAGLAFYNEAILITSVGSLALRAARIFSGGRKLGKAHQNVLVFCKGDPRRAADACGTLDIPDPAELFGTLGFADSGDGDLDADPGGGVPGGDHRRGGLRPPGADGSGDPDREHGPGDYRGGNGVLPDSGHRGAGGPDAVPAAEAAGVAGDDLGAAVDRPGGGVGAAAGAGEGGEAGSTGGVVPAGREMDGQLAGVAVSGAAGGGVAVRGPDVGRDRNPSGAERTGRVPRGQAGEGQGRGAAEPAARAGQSAGPSRSSPDPAWARGYPVARLREAAQLWKAHDGGLPMGAFMAVKENQVAAWAHEGRLSCWGRSGVLAAAAVLGPASGQQVTDFRGQPIAKPPKGATVVQRFAGDPVLLAAELAALPGPLWLWAWMENPADRWLAQTLGLFWQGTKIRASSELIGLYGPADPGLGAACPGLDIWGLVRLDREFDPAPLLAEVAAAEPGWADHYAVYNKRGTWQAVSLRGYGPDPGFIIKPAEMSRKWKAEHPAEMTLALTDTPLYRDLPGIRALVNSLPGKKHRVRLMRLAPGNGELTRHSDITDPDAGTAPGQLLRIHLPLVTNPQVIFQTWTPDGARQRAHMGAGEAWYLDTRKPHTARNDGPAERIHVVADIEASPKLLALATHPAPADPPALDYTPPALGGWQPWRPEG